MQIEVDNANTIGSYTVITKEGSFVSFSNQKYNCTYYTDATHPATVEITRLDLVNRVVSGRFAFTLEAPGCEKVVVTEGRFDSLF